MNNNKNNEINDKNEENKLFKGKNEENMISKEKKKFIEEKDIKKEELGIIEKDI